MSKIKYNVSIIHYTLCGAVCFQFTHFPCDDWESIYTLSYYHHQIGSMNYDTICGAVCFQFILVMIYEIIYIYIYTLSYYRHQKGSVNYYPLFWVRSWNNGVRCMSNFILIRLSHLHTDGCPVVQKYLINNIMILFYHDSTKSVTQLLASPKIFTRIQIKLKFLLNPSLAGTELSQFN